MILRTTLKNGQRETTQFDTTSLSDAVQVLRSIYGGLNIDYVTVVAHTNPAFEGLRTYFRS